MKKFNEEKLIEILAIVIIFAFIVFIWWLSSFPQAPENNEVETTRIVENSVESVENTIEETTEPQYIEKQMTVTAYCPCIKCCNKTDGITASGTKAKQGRTVAVDPRYIPYGTKIIIDGHIYISEDCGGAIKGSNRLDIFFDSHEEALEFGRQTKTVKVIL